MPCQCWRTTDESPDPRSNRNESVHFYAGFVFWKLARNSGRATSMLMMILAYCSSFEALIVAQPKSFWRLVTYMPCLLFHACPELHEVFIHVSCFLQVAPRRSSHQGAQARNIHKTSADLAQLVITLRYDRFFSFF